MEYLSVDGRLVLFRRSFFHKAFPGAEPLLSFLSQGPFSGLKPGEELDDGGEA